MNTLSEHIYLIGSIFGALISMVMLLQILKGNKANFFIGLVLLMMSIELFFSWGVQSGYVNSSNPIHYWKLLNYLIIPPGIWIFLQFNTNDNFRLKPFHWFLFIPALLAYLLEFLSEHFGLSLTKHSIWMWYTDYIPLLATTGVLLNFWLEFFRVKTLRKIHSIPGSPLSKLRMILLMVCLSIICVFWYVLSFSNGKYFEFVEFILLFLFFGLVVLNFIETQNFSPITVQEKLEKFPNYNDKENIEKLKSILKEKKPYLQSHFPLKELSRISNLPPKYISYLVNHHLNKNYKEFINEYRISYFLEKAKSEELNSKTLLGLALESGFNSKSTFNFVFKNAMGKSPSQYLKDYKLNSNNKA